MSLCLIEGRKEVFALFERDGATHPIRLAGYELLGHEVHPVPERRDQTYSSVTVERGQLVLLDTTENISRIS